MASGASAVVYPRSNRGLFERVKESGGIVSEYYLGEAPLPWRFPARNRLIAGLADVLVVVEAAEKSGALITARHALESGRDVWAVPGPLGVAECRGSNKLLADGAGVLWDIQDFVEEVAPKSPAATRNLESRGQEPLIPEELPQDEARVLAGIGFEPTPVDAVAGRSGVPLRELLSALALLELKGYVTRDAAGSLIRRPVGLSPQTIGRLWTQYLEACSNLSGDGLSSENRMGVRQEADQLRDRLLVNYSPLVKYVTGRVSARMTGAVDREDFMSSGLVGLLNAIETYDPEREAKFETYAISKIRWAMLDEARKEDSLLRRTRSRARQVEAARQELTQQLQREPTEAELAEKSDLSVADYRSVIRQQDLSQTSSLEAQSANEDGRDSGPQIADEAAANPESAIEQVEQREELISAMRELSERERTIVTLYFYEDLTLREIGQALGLTEGRISQILKKTLGKLRGFIGEDHLTSGIFV